MPVIALESAKGGTGKTTSTVYLAVALVSSYPRVTIVDADPQHSAADWSDVATSSGEPLPFETIKVATARGLDQTARSASRGGSLVLIDTPPGHGELIDAATVAADLVVVTSQPAEMDVRGALNTLRVVSSSGTPTLMLLTSVGLSERLGITLRAFLNSSEGVPLSTTVIPRRTHYREAFGSLPDQLGAYTALATEIRRTING